MHLMRAIFLAAGFWLLTMPAQAADTFQITINSNSPAVIDTGLIMEEGDRILVQASGAMRIQGGLPFNNGWFDPSGLGRVERAGQLVPDCPLGLLLGGYSPVLTSGFPLGDFALVTPPATYDGIEFRIGLNLPEEDLTAIEGAFVVHLTRYQETEVVESTVTLDADSARPRGTGLVAGSGDRFLVIGQGAARTITTHPVHLGWFDASGLGATNRVGQIYPEMPYGCLLGTFTGSLAESFYVGDTAAWPVQPGDIGNELMLGLNMSDANHAILQGQIVAHVLQFQDGDISAAHGEAVPGTRAIASVENFPNPFNPMTTVRFELTRPEDVRVSIVNVAGQVVQTLASRSYPAGTHTLTWDGRDSAGRGQASGTYFLRLDTDEGRQTHKLSLVR
jgi:hypothetical protein